MEINARVPSVARCIFVCAFRVYVLCGRKAMNPNQIKKQKFAIYFRLFLTSGDAWLLRTEGRTPVGDSVSAGRYPGAGPEEAPGGIPKEYPGHSQSH